MADSEKIAEIARKPRRRWWQVSLRTLLVLVTLLSIGLGWFVHRGERQRSAVRYDAGVQFTLTRLMLALACPGPAVSMRRCRFYGAAAYSRSRSQSIARSCQSIGPVAPGRARMPKPWPPFS